MRRQAAILFLLAALAVGWYNNRGPGTAVIDRTWRVVELTSRPADRVLLMPVKGVPVRAVADTWKAPRSARRLHEGQDIFARRGASVVSATQGIVVRIGENTLGGHTVSVLGSGGRYYYYAHLDRYEPALAVGDLVEPGSVLGYVGNTGNARTTPPHLHFGVYSAAGPVNPLPLLRADPANS